jgi:hypothetical protein
MAVPEVTTVSISLIACRLNSLASQRVWTIGPGPSPGQIPWHLDTTGWFY